MCGMSEGVLGADCKNKEKEVTYKNEKIKQSKLNASTWSISQVNLTSNINHTKGQQCYFKP